MRAGHVYEQARALHALTLIHGRLDAMTRRPAPMPSLRDLIPPTAEMTIAEALLNIRKARAALLTNGAHLRSEDVTVLAREMREVCEELDQVRALLMRDSEGL